VCPWYGVTWYLHGGSLNRCENLGIVVHIVELEAEIEELREYAECE